MLKCSILARMARVKLVALVLPLLILAAVACNTAEAQTLEGILQSINQITDSGEGEVVIVTQEGKTFRLTLVTEVDEHVVPGDFVEVELDEDEQVTALDNKSRQTAEEFAQECNDAGTVDLYYNLKVEGGQGSLDRGCQVSLEDGNKLEIIKATISGSTHDLKIEGNLKTELIIDEATIDLGAGALLFISSDESVVAISKSTLVGSPVDIGAAQTSSGSKGQMQVSDSTIRSPQGDVILRASENGAEGQVQLSDSVLVAAGDVRIATGEKGQTQVSNTEFDAENKVTIQAGEDGQCQSQDNTPASPCS